MIITKGTLNRVGFSLAELAIWTDPMEFRIVLISENSPLLNYELIKTPINAGKRLQIFEIDEGVEIDFAAEGYYSYQIYQTAANNLVEVGLLRVEGVEEQLPTITSSKNPQVYAG